MPKLITAIFAVAALFGASVPAWGEAQSPRAAERIDLARQLVELSGQKAALQTMPELLGQPMNGTNSAEIYRRVVPGLVQVYVNIYVKEFDAEQLYR